MCVGMCAGMCTDMRADMFTDMCVDTCVERCVDISSLSSKFSSMLGIVAVADVGVVQRSNCTPNMGAEIGLGRCVREKCVWTGV